MSETGKIKTAFKRYADLMNKRPSVGQETMRVHAKLRDGLTFDIQSGDWKFTADLPEGAGGNNEGPSPGTYGRFALASCLAIGYMLWANHLDIPINNIEIEIQADADDRQLFGVSDDAPHYTEIRYILHVESTATEKEVLHVLDTAEARSPMLSVFREPQTMKRIVDITQPKE